MVLLNAPANDNDTATDFVWRDGKRIYAIRPDERVAALGLDKLLVAHPARRPQVRCAFTGAFLGEIRA